MEKILYFCCILLFVVMISPLVSADGWYTQGWLGAPDWVFDRTDTSILPYFYYPKIFPELIWRFRLFRHR